MRRLAIFASLSALFAGGLLVGTVTPSGAASTCTGFISNKTFIGNLNVPPGAFCELQNVTITGNLTAQSGSELILDAPVHIQGTLTTFSLSFSDCSIGRGDVVQIDGTVTVNGGAFRICDNWKVGGNVFFNKLSGTPFVGGDPANVHINGNFTLQYSNNKFGQLLNWVVGGGGYINNNGGGLLDVTSSTFGNVLSCVNNATGFTGGGNKSGSQAGPGKNGFLGQCSALGAPGTP